MFGALPQAAAETPQLALTFLESILRHVPARAAKTPWNPNIPPAPANENFAGNFGCLALRVTMDSQIPETAAVE